MTKRILNVVTNVAHYEDPSEATGLWLSELTHAHHVFAEAGYEQTIVSPKGGPSPLEPRSLKFPHYDKSAKAWKADDAKMALLAGTASPDDIDAADFDAIYFTGGHAPVAVTDPPLPFERKIAQASLHAYMAKQKPIESPIQADEKNLLAGADVYKQNCAVCHGLPAEPESAIAHGMSSMRDDAAQKVLQGITTCEESAKRVFIEDGDDEPAHVY